MKTEQLVSIGRLDESQGLAHALDLSLGGIRFQCVGLDTKPGDMIKVTLTLGESTSTVVGQIKRAESLDEFTQEVALAFIKMDDEIRSRLEQHLPPGQEDCGRRAYERLHVESVVSVSPADLIDVVAQARDLSLGGIRFVLEGLELELAEVVRVVLDLAGNSVTAVGQVVRVTDCGELCQDVAIAFLEIDDASLEFMHEQLEDVEIDSPIS